MAEPGKFASKIIKKNSSQIDYYLELVAATFELSSSENKANTEETHTPEPETSEPVKKLTVTIQATTDIELTKPMKAIKPIRVKPYNIFKVKNADTFALSGKVNKRTSRPMDTKIVKKKGKYPKKVEAKTEKYDNVATEGPVSPIVDVEPSD